MNKSYVFFFVRRHRPLLVKESVCKLMRVITSRDLGPTLTHDLGLSPAPRGVRAEWESLLWFLPLVKYLKSFTNPLFFDEWNFLPCERNHKIVVWIWKENTKTWFEVNTSHQFFRDDRAYNSSCPTQSHRDTSQRETDWISSTRSEFDCAF